MRSFLLIDPNFAKRNSSVECFRMLSMFLVLIVHLNGIFVGLDPRELVFYNNGQLVIEAIAVICVNCFLVISGYYGIRFKWKSLWDLYLLLFFIKVPFFIVRCINNHELVLSDFFEAITPLTSKNYFINAYVLLLIFSPVLNTFIDKVGKEVWKYALLLFVIEFWFDCVRDNDVVGFAQGYTVLHFIVIYFIARSLYFHRVILEKYPRYLFLMIWVLSTAINCLMIKLKVLFSLSYTNPLVIVGALSLFLFFAKGEFHNKTVNWLAKSTFAVYIIHLTSPVATPYISLDLYCLNHFSYWMYLLCILGMATGMFIVSIGYDRIRCLLTEKMTDKLYSKIALALQKACSNGKFK